jgi:uncharacterized LabA/DUF88 family protein
MNDRFFPSNLAAGMRIMLFADGENLAIRFGRQLGDGEVPDQVPIIRRYYYTSVMGDTQRQDEIYDRLKKLGIEAPRVFKKEKSKGSKRVDISLATEMLSHAHRRNYDLAVLVAGDEDYVPAATAEGARVVLWFLRSGLSRKLERAADHYFDLTNVLMAPSAAAIEKREIDYLHD